MRRRGSPERECPSKIHTDKAGTGRHRSAGVGSEGGTPQNGKESDDTGDHGHDRWGFSRIDHQAREHQCGPGPLERRSRSCDPPTDTWMKR
jgi:hypothetical protein